MRITGTAKYAESVL